MNPFKRFINRLRYGHIKAVYAVPVEKLIIGNEYYDVIPGGALRPTKMILREVDKHRLYFEVVGKDYTRQSWVMRTDDYLVFYAGQSSPFWSLEEHEGHVGRLTRKK